MSPVITNKNKNNNNNSSTMSLSSSSSSSSSPSRTTSKRHRFNSSTTTCKCSKPPLSSITFAPSLHMSSTLSNVIVGTAAAVAGVLLGQLSKAAPDSGSSGGQPSCERCDGRGYVDCQLCTKWQTNFASADKARKVTKNCVSCHGSMRTKCPRCGGGGTAVPIMGRIPIPVRVDDGYNSIRRIGMSLSISVVPLLLNTNRKNLWKNTIPRPPIHNALPNANANANANQHGHGHDLLLGITR